MNPLQNPLLWTRRHQLAWAVVSAVGAVAGLLFGFIHSPAFSGPQTWGAFVATDPRARSGAGEDSSLRNACPDPFQSKRSGWRR